MKAPIPILSIFFLFAISALATCSKIGTEASTKIHGEHEKHDHEKASSHAKEENQVDHEDNHDESDLDRPANELFRASCEHDIKSYECEECRYEVGVVKADSSLFEGGLLKKEKANARKASLPLKLTGEVRFDERRVAHVSTQAEGIIKKVHVTLGDRVKNGQALVEIESVSVGEAQAEYLESKGMLALAKRNHSRVDSLHKEGISSEKELLVATQELDAAQIRADAALGKLTRLGMNASAARALTQNNAKGRLILRSPADGTLLGLHAVAGELARVEASLATVGDNSAMWVWADLYERDIAHVTEEQEKKPLHAVIAVKAFPGKYFSGQVDFVSPSMSESSRTVKARIAVPNPDGHLLAGMFAEVEIFIPGNQEVLVVPSESLFEDDGRTFIFVYHHGDYYVRRPVSPGHTFAGMTEVTKGLDKNDIVVTRGAFLLKSDVLRSKMGAGCAD